jgi:hypothetical protein
MCYAANVGDTMTTILLIFLVIVCTLELLYILGQHAAINQLQEARQRDCREYVATLNKVQIELMAWADYFCDAVRKLHKQSGLPVPTESLPNPPAGHLMSPSPRSGWTAGPSSATEEK